MIITDKKNHQKKIYLFFLFASGILMFRICSAQVNKHSTKKFGAIALKESVVPIHPGVPGKTPFWNIHAHQFIYAPAFNYKIIDKATRYLYKIVSTDGVSQTFESNVPYAPLSPVWASVPVGYFNLVVTGLSDKGDTLGVAGSGKYYRAAHLTDLTTNL